MEQGTLRILVVLLLHIRHSFEDKYNRDNYTVCQCQCNHPLPSELLSNWAHCTVTSARLAGSARHKQHSLCSWWNGTGTASNQASWNGSGRNIIKYARNMKKKYSYMHKICKYIDSISQICKIFARNMPEICQKYAYYMQLCAVNMQLYVQQIYRLY